MPRDPARHTLSLAASITQRASGGQKTAEVQKRQKPA
jgi:hypothetical protein